MNSHSVNFGPDRRKILKIFLSDSVYGWVLKLNFILAFFQIVIIFIFYGKIPPQIPIYYSRPWGEDQLADKNILFLLPAAILFFTFVNLFLASLFWEKEKLVAQITILISGLVSFLLTFVFVEIFFLVVF